MESTYRLEAGALPAAQQWAQGELRSWAVRSPYVDGWLDRAAQLLGDGPGGEVVLCFDEGERLLSLDVWCEGKRVFGMDDLV